MSALPELIGPARVADVARRPAPAPGISRILLATDLSASSEGATDLALQLTRGLGADLLAVSVIDPAGVLPGTATRMDQRRAARELAAQALVVRGRQAGVRVSFLVWEGEPGPAIVEAAASEHADLIVVGTHRRNRLERMVLGSVSDHVVRHAACPVLVAGT